MTKNKSALYCTLKMVKGVRTQSVIQPQPVTSDIVHVQHNYSNLGAYHIYIYTPFMLLERNIII